ncbi:YceI family protein [Aminobacter sp. AP02]|uniref:YceI family protein n=1 Tax=Aminobacter sp. AP02 TaxID=2135737 RepID=UPI000D6C1535|nr:YceI family protein [Aminobacter sp. AP02]PWK63156.1 polyisoprenoid-binding protein YceI [Aminobacter sp. AP02]
MSLRVLGVTSFLALGLIGGTASAVALSEAAGRYAISANGSSIRFVIGKAGGGGLNGAFGRFSGSISIDGGDIGRSKVDITIYPDSVGTGQGRVDAFLKSDAVFDAANSRQITFRSTSVQRTGDNSAVVTGQLTARGRTSTEKFQAELHGLKNGQLRFHVSGKVLRSRYGMDVGTPIYSNIVDFEMNFAARRA